MNENVLRRLLRDEAGAVMSAEMVVLGTVGVLALTAGMSSLTTSINSELNEVGQAFRGFDQSYSVQGYGVGYSDSGSGTMNGSWKAGSRYTQPTVRNATLDLEDPAVQLERREQISAERPIVGRIEHIEVEELDSTSGTTLPREIITGEKPADANQPRAAETY